MTVFYWNMYHLVNNDRFLGYVKIVKLTYTKLRLEPTGFRLATDYNKKLITYGVSEIRCAKTPSACSD